MDWNAAVEKNREALKRILAMLVAMAGFGGQFIFCRQKGRFGTDPARAEESELSPALTLPRHLHRAVLSLLRPAEAAMRRLVIVAARGLVVPPPRPSASPGKTARTGAPPRDPGPRALPLFDRLSPWRIPVRRVGGGVPRISVPGIIAPFPITSIRPDDPVDAARLASRLQALAAALDDLPGQAIRFARWRARTAVPTRNPVPALGPESAVTPPRRRTSRHVTAARSRRVWPLRPGRPPGWRRKPVHEVHDVLDVVHGLAVWALESPDTS